MMIMVIIITMMMTIIITNWIKCSPRKSNVFFVFSPKIPLFLFSLSGFITYYKEKNDKKIFDR